ncbi:hypothetical protein ASPSYDRAFT_87029 [Aspergillus sydowii CBS 593.65]|uniref:Uncharacterized protein n=1 Tax=Aspergillus sydowii CBS 593.65 TaxID=1036612 RepID=A0A1L9TLY8_9EURO|nr:uncharacterized protein ASPSYDRAFT_87029 [Aspergillus sydowii CBS 593.65]OJJ60444.1 hypothetical protein ASPSYDRAFT_87029 [Aspergillus sydowii CBS 593.65]
MNSNFEKAGANPANQGKGGQTGGGGGQADYLDKGLNQAEQRAGGQYYDADKMKGPNKKITDKIKDKFHETTGHNLPGTK